MITSGYEPVMTRLLRGSSPFDLAGKTRRTVEAESILKITGSSYRIDRVESVSDNTSSRKNTRMRAPVTVRLLPVSDSTIKRNPLGIYIENREMTGLK